MGLVIELFLPLALFVIMFSLGLGLTPTGFRRIAAQPRDALVGLVSQVTLLPAVAFLIALAWAPAPALAVGLVIIAAAPGGVTSNLLTRFAGGDVALSVTLTAVTSLAAIVTVPFVVLLALRLFDGGTAAAELSMLGDSLRMFVIVALPVALGMALRARRPVLAEGIQGPAERVSGLLFVAVLAIAIGTERENIPGYFAAAGLAVLALNLVMMALAWWGTALLACGRAQRIALALECGLQNGTLAIAVVATLGLESAYAVPAAMYSLVMFATALAFVTLMRRGAA